MNVLVLPLDTRPRGAGVISAESDLGFKSGFSKGWIVTLRHNDIRVQAQILDVDAVDLSYMGQVIDLEGSLFSPFDSLQIGCFLRFREEHIFACCRAG